MCHFVAFAKVSSNVLLVLMKGKIIGQWSQASFSKQLIVSLIITFTLSFFLPKMFVRLYKEWFYIMSDSMCGLRIENLHTSLAMNLLWRPGSLWHSVRENHAGSNNSVTSALCSQRPRCCCWCCGHLLLFRKKKGNTTVKTSYRQHDQYRPGRGRLISLFFFWCSEFAQPKWHPHMPGKRQYLCISFRKSLVDIHSCLTEWRKYPWSLKLLV